MIYKVKRLDETMTVTDGVINRSNLKTINYRDFDNIGELLDFVCYERDFIDCKIHDDSLRSSFIIVDAYNDKGEFIDCVLYDCLNPVAYSDFLRERGL